MRTTFVSAVLALLLATPSQTAGQISNEELDSLREVGKREGWTFKMAENPATRRSLEQLCGVRAADPDTTVPVLQWPSSELTLPSSFDWRKLGGVTPIKDQGFCGSCWAFANHGVLESVIKIKDSVTLDLSEQWLVSCNIHGCGCSGGCLDCFSYSVVTWDARHMTDLCGEFGVVLEEELPYTAMDDPCECDHWYELSYLLETWGYTYRMDQVPPVDVLKKAIMRYGPVFVGVLVDGPFQGYTSGVYNANYVGEWNHAVVLVGWDDNLGEEGAWILRNSWGTEWGMGGYMYIAYGVSYVGIGAEYVDYRFPKVVFWGDTTIGLVPLEVNFGAYSNLVADSWAWDFGDGGTGYTEAPSYTYTERGAYDVTVEMTSDGKVYSNSKSMYIMVIADTILSNDAVGVADGQVVVTLSAHNATPLNYIRIPVEFNTGDFALVYDSFSTVGCRTSYFEIQSYLHYDPWFYKRATLKLMSSLSGTSPELIPGEGPIAKLYFTIPSSATEGQAVSISLDGYDEYIPEFIGSKAEYTVPVVGCQIMCSEGCCQNRGDVNHSGTVDNADVVSMIEWAFSSGTPPPCSVEAEVDGIPGVNIDDLLYLVDYIYHAGLPPPACP